MQGGSLVRYRAACMAGGEVVLVDLVKRFADVTAVAGINLDMPPGEFFSLLGPSGCGKTTTLRMIAGFERPDGGQIPLGAVAGGAAGEGGPPPAVYLNPGVSARGGAARCARREAAQDPSARAEGAP